MCRKARRESGDARDVRSDEMADDGAFEEPVAREEERRPAEDDERYPERGFAGWLRKRRFISDGREDDPGDDR